MSDGEEFRVSALARKRAATGSQVAGPGPAPELGPESASAGASGIHRPVPLASERVNPIHPITPTPTASGSLEGGMPEETAAAGGFSLPFDPLRILIGWVRWWWIPLGMALGMAGLAIVAGLIRFKDNYTASVYLVRRDLPNTFRASESGEAFKPRQLSEATIVSMMESKAFLQRFLTEHKIPSTAREFALNLTIVPQRNTDLIAVSLKAGNSTQAAADLVNKYAEAVVDLTADLQNDEASEVATFLGEQMERLRKELEQARAEILEYAQEAEFFSAEQEVGAYLRELADIEQRLVASQTEQESLDFRITSVGRELSRQNPRVQRLHEERDLLNTHLTRYTEANPIVMDQRAKVEALEQELKDDSGSSDFQFSGNVVANSLYLDLVNMKGRKEVLELEIRRIDAAKDKVREKLRSLPVKGMEYARIHARRESLEQTLAMLSGREREAVLFAQESPGYYRVFAPALPEQVEVGKRSRKLAIVAVAGLILGGFLGLLGVGVRELLDDRILSPSDVARASGAPVLARLGDVSALDAGAARMWRFRTLSNLLQRLGNPPGERLEIAVTSLESGEGRSTWLEQLQRGAIEQGFPTLMMVNSAPVEADVKRMGLDEAVERLGDVRDCLMAGGSMVVVWKPDSVWDKGFREKIGTVMSVASDIKRRVILVELPPVRDVETVMAAALFPNVLWLAASGKARQKTALILRETLRSGQVRVAGSLANRVPRMYEWLPDLSRYGLILLGMLSLFLGHLGSGLQAAEPVSPVELSDTDTAGTRVVDGGGVNGESGTFSATAAAARLAPWQQRLTLGPGDILTLSYLGEKDLTRAEVPVGPDGRISYLQAQDVTASGLTVDELREALNGALREYHRHPRVVVTPVAWRSKKYYLLGTVQDPGVYTLERPTSIIEAVARARGMSTGLLDLNTVEIVDLARAMLVRKGERVAVNFERLFQHGDLTQNVLLEPEDYLFFPSSSENDAYILGSVINPGPMGVTESATVVGLITVRGGFTERAYRQRVLVVRGSLTEPETFVINVAAILSGREKDFPVQPKDIIYVAERPWARAEDLLDIAVSAFVITASTTWTSQNIGPIITNPIVPGIR